MPKKSNPTKDLSSVLDELQLIDNINNVSTIYPSPTPWSMGGRQE